MEDRHPHQPKDNLVLVNAFFTNSILLKGLIDYLSKYFHVYFIDLPGFIQSAPPLSKITLENYTRYVQKKIASLHLKSYFLGGISFGFLVINALASDKGCKGIVAIAPYVNARWLRLNLLKKSVYFLLVRLTLAFDLSSRVWKSHSFKKVFHWYSNYPAERINILLEHLDAKTFFETARIILTRRQTCEFQDLPYVLIVSSADRTISTYPLIGFFDRQVKNLKIVRISIDHYPLDISEDYFRQGFPEKTIQEIIIFFNGKTL